MDVHRLKLRPCQTDVMFLHSLGDQAGQEKIKVYYEIICITKITMIAKYLEDTSVYSQPANSLCFLATRCLPLCLTAAAAMPHSL